MKGQIDSFLVMWMPFLKINLCSIIDREKQKKIWKDGFLIFPEIQLKKRHLLYLAALCAFQSRIKFSLLDYWVHGATAYKTRVDVSGYDSIQSLTHPLIMIIHFFDRTLFQSALSSPSQKQRKSRRQHTVLV